MGIMIGIIVVLVVLIFYIISIYNRLVKLRIRRENAFADIDVQLKQRHDLIPQLVSAVKGYIQHEEGVLTKVTEARSKAMNAGTIDEKIVAEKQLSGALAGLRIQVEAYPELKSNQNFMHLQTEISDIENKLAAVRRFFNSATKELNTAIQVFPNVIFAGMFGFKSEPMFDVGEDRAAMDKAPDISFK
ncbi:MAG TPA: LemA family protein [Cyclobacteriaceae bacterium]|nr:LemA family protein [Cyclobacteriaceae bacterium]